MEDVVETLTRGNPTEVKVLLASVALALGVYQVFLISVGYAKVRLPFLASQPASRTHRAVGDTIVVLLVVVSVMCLGVYGFDDEGVSHGIVGLVLVAVLALKVSVVRRGLGLGRFLPLLGLGVLGLLLTTWLLSAGDFLAQ